MRPPGSPIPLEDDLVLPNQSPPGTPTPIRVCDEELVHDPTPEKIDDPPVVVADTNVVKNAPGAPDDAAFETVLKKRKRDLRGIRPKEEAPRRKARPPQLPPPDDRPSAPLPSMVSNLFSRHGMAWGQFYEAFSACDDCRRIVCNETCRIEGHICIIEIGDDD